jgi:serine/threonine protein kinase
MIGQLLDGRYRVVSNLSSGGFGETYIAEDTKIPGNPSCVVKHLKPANSAPEYLQIATRLFTSEAETLAKLGNYDRIPRLLAYFTEGQEFYLVEEFVAGNTLGKELQPGQRWSESQVIQLLDDILTTLEFVHSHGVIHRDIKPDNIIRRESDRKFALIDFGAIKQMQNQLATQMESLEPTVNPTVAVGTPGYMPTEQAKGRPRPSSDIYALGAIAVQAMTGMNPRELRDDPNTGEISWQHLSSVSAPLTAIVTKMMAYHFKDRYPTAKEARQALSQLIHPPALHRSTETIGLGQAQGTVPTIAVPAHPNPQSLNPNPQFPPTQASNPPFDPNTETIASNPNTLTQSAGASIPQSFPAQNIPASQPTQPIPVPAHSTPQQFLNPNLSNPNPPNNIQSQQPQTSTPSNNGVVIALWAAAAIAAIGLGALFATRGASFLSAFTSPTPTSTPTSTTTSTSASTPSPSTTTESPSTTTITESPSTTTTTESPSPIPTLTETEAVQRVRDLVEAKREMFAPPFNREILTQVAIGEEYEKRKGSIDWLQKNNAYYSYGEFEINPLGQFNLQGDRATIEVEIAENPTLYVNGQVDQSQSIPSRGRYRCTLQLDQQSWKVANIAKI